jgi:hypothetical protein
MPAEGNPDNSRRIVEEGLELWLSDAIDNGWTLPSAGTH